MSGTALQPTEQKTIFFYDDEITAVVINGDEQEVYIPLRPLCEHLGLDWSGQRQRINRDPVLSEVVSGVGVTPTPLGDNKFANPQEMLCLPLDYLNGWLFGINANRVKDEIRDKLIRYQKECYRVLAREFIQASPPTPSSTSSLQSVYEMGMAIAHLAQEQMQFERRLDRTGAIVQETAVAVDGLQQRVQELEGALASDEAVVTPDEAMQISQAVKTVAIAEGKRTGRNEFGATYGELYRTYGVTSYKQVPRKKFKDVMKWLSDWYISISDDEWPF